MKIKNLIIFYPSFERGGVEQIIKNLVTFNKKRRVKIFLITNKNKNTNEIENINNLYISSLPIKKNKFIPYRIWSSINCSVFMYHLIKKLDKKNTLIHSMQSNILAIIVAKILKFKIAIRNSEDPISSIKYAENKLISYIIFILRFIFYNMPDKIITNSKGSANSLKLFLFGENKKKIKYIYNPYLSEKKIKLGKKKFSKKKIILSVGRLTKQKNFKYLIDSFAKSKIYKQGYVLNIIGDGSEKKNLLNQIKNLNIKRYIKLLGYKKNTINYYKKSELFVLPSKYEGLGNVLIDAINFETPCIATDCKSGPKEVLCNGKGGTIVPNGNINALVSALKNSLYNYKDSFNKMKFAKKHLTRFYISRQSKIYFKELNKIM